MVGCGCVFGWGICGTGESLGKEERPWGSAGLGAPTKWGVQKWGAFCKVSSMLAIPEGPKWVGGPTFELGGQSRDFGFGGHFGGHPLNVGGHPPPRAPQNIWVILLGLLLGAPKKCGEAPYFW